MSIATLPLPLTLAPLNHAFSPPRLTCFVDHHARQQALPVQAVQRALQLAAGRQLLGRDEQHLVLWRRGSAVKW